MGVNGMLMGYLSGRDGSVMGQDWTPISPKDALVLRGCEAGVLFRSEIERALRRFNPWLTDAAGRSVVKNLQALPPPIDGNCNCAEMSEADPVSWTGFRLS